MWGGSRQAAGGTNQKLLTAENAEKGCGERREKLKEREVEDLSRNYS